MKILRGFLEKILMPVAIKFTDNKHLTALKDGFVFAMPFLIVGSFSLLLINLPLRDQSTPLYMEWYDNLMIDYRNSWLQPYYATMGIMSIFVSFSLGSSLANQYKLNGTIGGFLSMFSFILISAPIQNVTLGNDAFGMKVGESFISINANYLGSTGLFVAIIGGYLSVELYRLMVKVGLIIKMPDSVPYAVARSFEAITPIIFIIAILHPVSNILLSKKGAYIPQLLMDLFAPMIKASDTLPAILLTLFFIHFLWFVGLHGSNIIIAIITPFLIHNLNANQAALKASEELSNIFTYGFNEQFAYAGGAGATLGLTILMLFSENNHLKAIGRLSIVPGIFNINETVMFGAPVVLNPALFIPFITVPLVNGTIAWYAAKYGFIKKIISLVPWTTPAPIAAFLSSNLAVSNIILSVALIGVAMIIYWPFLKVYELILSKEEKEIY